MNKESVIVFVILLLIFIQAVKGTVAHLKGEGSCCGGSKDRPIRKIIKGKKRYELIVKIDGMHCNNCKNRIEKKLNEIDGIVAKVYLNKKEACVSVYQNTDDDLIQKTIEKLGYVVVDMTRR